MAKAKSSTSPRPSPKQAQGSSSPVDNSEAKRQLAEAREILTGFEGALNQVYTVRSQYLRELMDPRRNINHDCGFPDFPTVDHYQQLFDRNPFAQRAVEVMAREAFQVTPKVTDQTEDEKEQDEDPEEEGDGDTFEEDEEFEDKDLGGEGLKQRFDNVQNFNPFDNEDDSEDDAEEPSLFSSGDAEGEEKKDSEKKESEFDEAWRTLGSRIRGTRSWHRDDEGSAVMELLMRGAVQANICQYGVMVVGLNDGVEMHLPVAGVEEKNSMPAPTGEYDEEEKRYTINIAAPGKDEHGKDVIKARGRTVLWKDPYKDTRPVVNQGLGVCPQYSIRTTKDLHTVLTLNAEGKPERVDGERKISFVNVFPESSAMVTRWESNRTSPRYGQPVSYLITFNSPWGNANYATTAPSYSVDVHWTRVIHIPGRNVQSSSVVAQPEMLPLINDLLTLDKVRAAMGEGYWKSAFPGLALSTHPELGKGAKVDPSLRNQIENYENTLTRVLVLMGMSASTLPPSMVDPTPYIEQLIQAICIKLGIPKRKFMGSERGELASSDDEGDWNDKLAAYWKQYLIPRVLVPFVDWMIMLGVLPEPKEYRVDVPDMDAQNKKEKADVALVITQAMVAAVQAGLFDSGLITEEDWLVGVCGFEESDVKGWLERAQAQQVEREDEMDMFGEEQGFKPLAPDGMVDPEEREMQHEVELARAKNPGKPQGFGGGAPPNGNPKPSPFGGRS